MTSDYDYDRFYHRWGGHSHCHKSLSDSLTSFMYNNVAHFPIKQKTSAVLLRSLSLSKGRDASGNYPVDGLQKYGIFISLEQGEEKISRFQNF